jgi:hypothetical protein
MPSLLATAPEKVLDSIFVFCDYGELFASSHVCTSWRRRTGNSVMWRRVAQEDLDRARVTEYQIVATPVQKRAELSSSFNAAHLYTVEVRTRHRLRGCSDYSSSSNGIGGIRGMCGTGSANVVPSYAQNLQMYSFGAGPTSVIASSVTSAYGGGVGGSELERNPSSTCFTTVGSTAKVRRVCVRYIRPLRFTVGDAVAAAHRQALRSTAPPPSSADSSSDAEDNEKTLPLWEDGSLLRAGVLICDPHDPCVFCYYAATLRRPWCTVLMDQFVIDDALLVDFIEHSRDGGATGGEVAAICIDLAFRVEELAVVRNDPRDPSHLVRPAQPVSIRIGVIEESQLNRYQRGLQQIVSSMTFSSPTDGGNAGDSSKDSSAKLSNDFGDFYGNTKKKSSFDTAAQDYAWGALAAGAGGAARRGGDGDSGVSWSYTAGGGPTLHDGDDPNSAAAAEAEVLAWLHASVQESMQASQSTGGALKTSAATSKPVEFWSQVSEAYSSKQTRGPPADLYTSHGNAARECVRLTDVDVTDKCGDCAYVLGDTPGSFGYDMEGSYISEASSYPLGAPLQKGDVVHLQFLHDEDVIVVTRNRERLGTLVADAFSEGQRWCVAVSLQNCAVRFIPPRLN